MSQFNTKKDYESNHKRFLAFSDKELYDLYKEVERIMDIVSSEVGYRILSRKNIKLDYTQQESEPNEETMEKD